MAEEILPKTTPEIPVETGRESGAEQPLTPEYAARLIFLSFRFSQGDSELQENILHYVVTIHPGWRVDGQSFQNILAATQKSIEKFFYSAGKHNLHIPEEADTIQDTSRNWASTFRDALNRKLPPQPGALIPRLTRRVIERDFHYKAGRPDGDRKKVDPASSQLCYYGLLGTKTGAKEYDQMFQGVISYLRASIQANTLPAEDLVRLEEVVATYNTLHPEAPAPEL